MNAFRQIILWLALAQGTGTFGLYRAPNGQAVITLFDKGLSSEQSAVESIAHELNHARGVMSTGEYTTEAEAEAAAQSAGQNFQ